MVYGSSEQWSGQHAERNLEPDEGAIAADELLSAVRASRRFGDVGELTPALLADIAAQLASYGFTRGPAVWGRAEARLLKAMVTYGDYSPAAARALDEAQECPF